MRKLILGLVALATVMAMSDSASARERRYRVRNNRQYSQQPAGYYQENDRPSLFGGLIEMERRKNAWLRETFFGR